MRFLNSKLKIENTILQNIAKKYEHLHIAIRINNLEII